MYYLGSDGAINKIKTDGTNETRLASTEASLYPVSFVGDWIYYVNNNEIWKIKTDGTSNVKIFRPAVEELNIYGVQNGWIYIGGIESTGKYILFKIYETDPKEIRLTDFNIDSVNLLNGWVYFSEFYAKEDYELMKADGTVSRIIK